MPTTTRTGRASSASRARFGRSTGAARPPARFARSAPAPSRTGRVQGLRRRHQPEPSGLKKLAGGVLSVAAARKAAPSSKKGKAGGLALVAAAAGMAFKNRDKLAGMRQKDDGTTASSANNASAPPVPPAV